MRGNTWVGPLTDKRRTIIEEQAKKIAQIYELPMFFWRREFRALNRWMDFGKPEDRDEAASILVGSLLARGFQRHELVIGLEMANGTIGQYAVDYKKIPDETKRIIAALSGELAPRARKEFLDDARRRDSGQR